MFLEPIPSGIRGTGSSLVRIMNRTRLIARSSVAEMNVRFSTGHMGPIHSVDFARRLASQDLLLHFPRRRSLPLSGMNSLGSLLFCFSDCISSLGSFLKLTCGPQHAAADAADAGAGTAATGSATTPPSSTATLRKNMRPFTPPRKSTPITVASGMGYATSIAASRIAGTGMPPDPTATCSRSSSTTIRSKQS